MSDEASELLVRLRALLERVRDAGDAELVQSARAAVDELLAPAATEPEANPVGDSPSWHGIIGNSPSMLAMRDSIERFARVDSPVLIRGESGTGKDLVARVLHELSPRRAQPMVSENCAAIPETLLESTLFGHKRGSFTGAIRDHPGHFVAAHRGTLFLDEIGDMPLPMQAKILRALQEGEVRAVGSEKTRKVDVRVIAATNRDLDAMVREGTFREDLFFRLNVLRLELPPLRERGGDAVLLARQILASAAAKADRALHLSAGAEAAIAAFKWPGNIRQLQNELQRTVALADGPEIEVTDLSEPLQSGRR